MSLEGFHLRVAQIALRALGHENFALGGGYALQAHGIVDRESDDLDAYTESMEVSTFERAKELILAADLRAAHEQDPDDYLAYGLSLADMDAMFERLEKASERIKTAHKHGTTLFNAGGPARKPKGTPDGGVFAPK